ncbi:hypothetical protein A3A64_04185 [Candidatus Gottesmanbacteria bacterium RIFCSPLOWO2_01_FULL_48_11]|uniref:Methionyl-tRNA formyltransferase n=2 Tax=Candidatus Gottesmaniibacteriota TaxID=1752720 RepID=A0A0G1WZD1_9BACT|nr:MAG: Methionyl-tRNA formyltransferase [Candidatus Gottesmanbacteria bacterium GW2011_GWA2_47_9]OGG27898.1 MAG: hypothetical protein A3A64_04185 [Candidatus Gottesmanbacteria bacterium RIFCSPLOWO2_01_FULL_48_11]
MNIIFFGSTSDSILVLSRLHQFLSLQFNVLISAVVTQPSRPVGRKQVITPTPVEIWAKTHNIPVISFPHNPSQPQLFADDQVVIDTLQPFKADLLVSASFGQKIPWQTIQATKFGGLNVHPSLLPRWRGADPVPWAIMAGDAQTGVTIVTLSKTFDAGEIIAQKKLPITDKDFSDPLRTKLFELGAVLLMKILPEVSTYHTPGVNRLHTPGKEPYARRLTRDDGFEPWKAIQKAFEDSEEAKRIDRKFRALSPWPGVWSEIKLKSIEPRVQGIEKKRLKILALHLAPKPSTLNPTLILDSVQLEGKNPVSFNQFKKAYLPPLPATIPTRHVSPD